MSRRESAATARRTGWDPLLIISQIVALQACHYLVLCLIIPPVLYLFADPLSLSLEGGASNVAMVIDWREMAGQSTINEQASGDYTRLPPSLGRHGSSWKHPQQKQIFPSDATAEPVVPEANSGEPLEGLDEQTYEAGYAIPDPVRGWVLGLAWVAASSADVMYIYYLIRRPTHILDFSLTLIFIHVILTTYYASSFPTSLFFWAIMAGSSALQIIWSEQLCVRREMKEGFTLGQGWKTTDEREEEGLPGPGGRPPRRQRRNSAPSAVRYERIALSDLT